MSAGSSSSAASFRVVVHEAERIIEVTYPRKPTADSLADYEAALKAAVEKLGTAGWRCLVNQTNLDVLAPELSDRITEMNKWALKHGLVTSARVVKQTAVGELQSKRILRESGVDPKGRVFHDRAEAWKRLTEPVRPRASAPR